MTRLRLIRENIVKPTRQVMSAVDVYSVMRFLEKEDREKFYVLHLDAKNRILAMELVSIGTLTYSLVQPREIFKAAIVNNSCSIVCVHNHPSGDATPSPHDKDITAQLWYAGEILGISVMDHVIIGHGEFSRVITPKEENEAKKLQSLHEKSLKRKALSDSKRRKIKAA